MKVLFSQEENFKELSIEELEQSFQFHYTSKLVFDEEKLGEAVRKKVAKQQLNLKQKELGLLIDSAACPDISIRWIDVSVGYGVFAEEEIAPGTYIGEYTGVIHHRNTRKTAEAENTLPGLTTVRYCDEDLDEFCKKVEGPFLKQCARFLGELCKNGQISLEQHARVVKKYRLEKIDLFTIEQNAYAFEYFLGKGVQSPYLIDAKPAGNHTRFINHSDQPNLAPTSAYADSLLHVILRSIKPIAKGEQLAYNYGPSYWSKGRIKINV